MLTPEQVHFFNVQIGFEVDPTDDTLDAGQADLLIDDTADILDRLTDGFGQIDPLKIAFMLATLGRKAQQLEQLATDTFAIANLTADTVFNDPDLDQAPFVCPPSDGACAGPGCYCK